MAFALNGGHPALDFVNTLDNRFRQDGAVELLGTYADVVEFMRQSGLLTVRQTRSLVAAAKRAKNARKALRTTCALRELREAAAAALYGAADGNAPAAGDLLTLERHFLTANRHRRLEWLPPSKSAPDRAGARWVWGRSETELELPVWMLAEAVSELLTSAALGRLRACGSESCRWLFLDNSKNHTRRWCDMRICGNRMKARRFHARRRA